MARKRSEASIVYSPEAEEFELQEAKGAAEEELREDGHIRSDLLRREAKVISSTPLEGVLESIGERVEVTWGDKLFQPLKFHGMRVGPFTASTIVLKGESVAEAMLRLHQEMELAAKKIFEKEADEYLKNVATLFSKASKVEVP